MAKLAKIAITHLPLARSPPLLLKDRKKIVSFTKISCKIQKYVVTLRLICYVLVTYLSNNYYHLKTTITK